MLKFGFNRLCDDDKKVSLKDAQQLFAANLVSLKHPYVVAILDENKEHAPFDYNKIDTMYKDIKRNINDKWYKERLDLFKQYDLDKSGFIDKADLATCLLEDGYYEQEELETVIELVMLFGDKNRDGKLSYIEFLKMCDDPDNML